MNTVCVWCSLFRFCHPQSVVDFVPAGGDT
uniref:Uncharacterized protein n=1 Tax=Anguilla anguilla TaxID=7936 RepID=A0A0E9RIU1_ANGAN